MGRVIINGTTIDVPDGETVNISSRNGNISINANNVYSVGPNDNRKVAIEVIGAIVGDVKADGSVQCTTVGGSVSSGGSLSCGNVGGNASSGGSMKCGKIHGSAVSGGSMQVINNG